MTKAVGIDLGTTYTLIAYIDDAGKPAILPNRRGQPKTPSVLFFGLDDNILIGEDAKEMQELGQGEVASFFKRNMGDPLFRLHFHGRDYSPVELSALLLAQVKKDAEAHLGENITDAVITVPAYFNNNQREATIEAGHRAHLNVLRIINEPTAAALAYGLQQNGTHKRVLVYDLGGGTFDIALLELHFDTIDVLATDGEHELGGKDWDDQLLRWAAGQFETEYGLDPFDDLDSVNELLVAAEKAKMQLSSQHSTQLNLRAFGKHGRYLLDRQTFTQITQDLLMRTQMLTERLLKTASCTWKQLDGVLLVGGSTRMPMVREYVERMSGKAVLAGVNVDEAVACGASIQAALDLKERGGQSSRLRSGGIQKMRDVTSHSLGVIATNGDRSRYVNTIILPKNRKIPSTEQRPFQFRTQRNLSQNYIEVFITQGESERPIDCAYLGKYIVHGIPYTNTGYTVVDIAYTYDQNGVVQVTATEHSTGQYLEVTRETLTEDPKGRFSQPPPAIQVAPVHVSALLCIDLSGSMSGQPLEQAQKAMHSFVEKSDLSHCSLGLVVFSDESKEVVELCQNAKRLTEAIHSLSIGLVGYGNAASPFAYGKRLLAEHGEPRFLIVLTDGVWCHQTRALEEAKECRDEGVEIIMIGFGSADERFLKQAATSDSSAFYTSMEGLVSTFGHIAQVLTEQTGLATALRTQSDSGNKKSGILTWLKWGR